MLRMALLSFVLLMLAGSALAQEPRVNLRREVEPRETLVQDFSTTVSATPEMWLYQQERSRFEDPKQAIRRRAEEKAQARRDRLEAMAWYGYSNSRPLVSTTPLMGGYSAHWASNTYDPFRWTQTRGPLVVLRPGEVVY